MNVVGGASVVLAGCSGAAAHAPLCSDYTGHSSSGVALTLLTCHRYRSSVLLSDTRVMGSSSKLLLWKVQLLTPAMASVAR